MIEALLRNNLDWAATRTRLEVGSNRFRVDAAVALHDDRLGESRTGDQHAVVRMFCVDMKIRHDFIF